MYVNSMQTTDNSYRLTTLTALVELYLQIKSQIVCGRKSPRCFMLQKYNCRYKKVKPFSDFFYILTFFNILQQIIFSFH